MQLQTEYQQLVNELNLHNYRYHVLDQPTITDAEFDKLLRVIRSIEAEHPDWITPESPTQRVGAPASGRFPSVAHPRPVLSLANAFSPEDLIAWVDRIRKLDSSIDKDGYVMEPKIDGLTIVLTYRDGVLVQGATRGDGIVGEDITANLRAIRAVPLRIPLGQAASISIPETLVVRGEVYMETGDFERLNEEIVKSGEKPYINPRNTASGSLRQLDPAVTASRPLKLFIYQILDHSADAPIPVLQTERTAYLRELGFPTLSDAKFCANLDEILADIPRWTELREAIRYEIDGVVIKINNLEKADALGFVGKDPRGAIALKFPAREVITRLNEIGVNVGRTGVLTPYAMLDAVEVGGVTVKQATLHNFDFIRDRDIRIGDRILLKRAGDVIPYVVAPIPESRDGSQQPYQPPSHCPSCGESVEIIPGEVAIYCVNSRCPAQLVRNVEHFASKSAMDIDGLGIKIVEQLCGNELIQDVADLYTLTKMHLMTLPGFAEKKADNLLAAIDTSKSKPLARLINALGVHGVGEVNAVALANRFGSIDALMEASVHDLTAIDGIGLVMAEAIADWFANERNQSTIAKLKEVGVNPVQDIQSGSESLGELIFSGMTIVATGTLSNFSREEIKALIQRNGGKAGESVSKKTDFVIAGEKAGSKLEKALALGVPVYNESEFLAAYPNLFNSDSSS